MAEYQEQNGEATSGASDELLRRYLLCRLGPDERLKLDERLLTDDQLAESVLLAESELTDAYVAGDLDTVERELFEKKFLTTEARKQRLRFTSALHDYSASQGSLPSVTPVEIGKASPQAGEDAYAPSRSSGFGGFLGVGSARIWAMAGSLAVVIVLLGLGWFVARRPDRESVIVRNEPVPAPSPLVSPLAQVSPGAPASSEPLATPSKRPAAIPTPAEPAAPTTVASFVLLPGALRDGGDMQRIAVPDGERDLVRVQLVLETGSEGVYQAEVTTAEGQKVTVFRKLKADSGTGEPKLMIDIPARLLQNGDYQIKLTRQKPDGQLEPVGRYYFRALE